MKAITTLCLLPFLGVAQAQVQGEAPAGEPVIVVGGEAFYSWDAYLNSPRFRGDSLRCGTPTVDNVNIDPNMARATSDCDFNGTSTLPQYEPTAGEIYRIPVVFHVISNTSGTGNMANFRVHDQMTVLNEDFRAIAGTPGAPGTDTRIEFFLATEDPGGSPTNGINRVTNNTWFNDGGSYRQNLNWNPSQYLNIYTNTASGFLGYASLPNGGGVAGTSTDGVTLLYSAVGFNAPIGNPYNKGRTATHEVGHYIGLLHTFQPSGNCSNIFCANQGDLICDTNAEQDPRFGCQPAGSSCGTSDPVRNYMDYSDDTCFNNFTPNQANRMRCTIENFRSALPEPPCAGAATTTIRNAGSNPNVHTASKGVIGDTQSYSLTIAPYDFGVIIGYADQDNQVLGGGQVALVDLGSSKFFQFNNLNAPSANVEVDIPLDVAFCGVSFTSQGLLFGGVSPFALTNAVDHVMGNF